MRRRLPPLHALRAFESAAEHESFSAAAEEIGVTRGAVSQQVRILEDWLGQTLFVRTGRGVRLSDAGRQFHHAVHEGLGIVERATERLRPPKGRATVKLSVLPAFASMWLVPRFGTFQAAHPGIEVQLHAEPELVDFERSDADIGIRYGAGEEVPGGEVHPLGGDELFPVCTPDYVARAGLREPGDLARCQLLHDTYWLRDWQRWSSAAGVDLPNRTAGQVFTHYAMAVEAARGRSHWYSMPVCPHCQSPGIDWTPVPGAGEIFTPRRRRRPGRGAAARRHERNISRRRRARAACAG